ncbi:MAG: cation diffusion facilitator family transporter [Gemmatimonadota bacterium]|nr:cation diffusion facilitator family transporter [Gemmatimonadota bacterium]
MTRSRHARARRATGVGIAGNTLLFAVKGTIGFFSGSIALLSDAVNSLVDVVASVAIWWSVEVAHREPDVDHPFGHHRAEAIAALGVAIFTAILGFEIFRAAIERLIGTPEPIGLPGWAIGALLFSMAGNLALARYLRRRGEALESPAILANAVECENDIWTSLAALVGVTAAVLGWTSLDPLAGMGVGVWIVWGGYRFGRQNIDYLMGKSPGAELVGRIRRVALGAVGVRGVHDVRAHYVGHRVHVEAHIEVDQELSTLRSHDVAEEVADEIERLPRIDRAFVHVDPVLETTYVIDTLSRRERVASEVYERLAGDAERPELGELWQALSTRALARAERLQVVRRLRGAGWHFADAEIEAGDVDRGLEEARRLAARLEEDAVGTAEAIGIAEALEGDEVEATYRRATTPRDAALTASLDAGSPPPPSASHLRSRIDAAREAVADPKARRALDRLARSLGA